MACPEFENRILAHLEGSLVTDEHSAVAAHLAGCADCQALARQWRQLDLALSRELQPPALRADFNQRLWARLEAEPAPATSAGRAERLRQLEAEFAAQLKGWRRRLSLGGLADIVGVAALAILLAVAGGRWLPGLPVLTSGAAGSSNALLLGLCSLPALACLLAGLAVAFRPRLARWLPLA